MRVWKWRILARQWRRNDGHQRTHVPGDYPLSHGPTFSFVPSPLAWWINFITSKITVSSTITIIHTWQLTYWLPPYYTFSSLSTLKISFSNSQNHRTSTQRTHMGSSRCRTPSRERHRILRTTKRTGEKESNVLITKLWTLWNSVVQWHRALVGKIRGPLLHLSTTT